MSKSEIDWNIIDNKTDEKLNKIETKLDLLLSKNDNVILNKIDNIEKQLEILKEKIDSLESKNSTRLANHVWRSQSGLISIPNLSYNYLNRYIIDDNIVNAENID